MSDVLVYMELGTEPMASCVLAQDLSLSHTLLWFVLFAPAIYHSLSDTEACHYSVGWICAFSVSGTLDNRIFWSLCVKVGKKGIFGLEM